MHNLLLITCRVFIQVVEDRNTNSLKFEVSKNQISFVPFSFLFTLHVVVVVFCFTVMYFGQTVADSKYKFRLSNYNKRLWTGGRQALYHD